MSEVLHYPGQRNIGRRVFRKAANGRDRFFGVERKASGGIRHFRECADCGDKGWPREAQIKCLRTFHRFRARGPLTACPYLSKQTLRQWMPMARGAEIAGVWRQSSSAAHLAWPYYGCPVILWMA